MIVKIASELALRLLVLAAPTLPPLVPIPDVTARNERRLSAKSIGRGIGKRG